LGDLGIDGKDNITMNLTERWENEDVDLI